MRFTLLGLGAAWALSTAVSGQTCTADTPCAQGCCNGQTGNCGFGPDYCGSACISNCNATAECGQYAPAGQTDCPLNVCCSKFGFCGTTSDFCGDGCQNGCDTVNTPSCGGSSSAARYIGYYESWSPGLPCDSVTPDEIDPTPWTHLNYAFALIDSGSNEITQMNSYDLQYYTMFNNLKKKNTALKTFISVGGWAAGGQVFSNMAATSSSRSAFINSAISLMKQYGFDGIDIDWEYPSASDRGGVPADAANFVELLKELRAACGSTYLITATIPSSYWYMQGFDIVNMEQYLDWFNFMSYDIHGTWDGDSPYTQRVVQPHTNLTEISEGLSLLWRNNISPSKVLLGLGFYGRSFTLSSSSCNTVDCAFSAGGSPGPCTGTSGILSNYEMDVIVKNDNPQTVYNAEAGVNWMTWGGNQWVSYDDGRTLAQKASYADGLCLGGLFSWALDLGGPGTLASPHDPSIANGTGLDGHDPGSSEVVYISPDIWTEPNPTVACEPPCTLVFPPKTLSTPTTISFPPYVTSLEVAWSTTYTVTTSGQTLLTTSVARTIEQTTLTIPPVTTTLIPVWNWPITDNATTSASYTLTSSILPPPFTVTDDPNPQSISGVSHPPVTRTITPPPYPWPSTTATSSTSNGILLPVFFTSGPPAPTCTSGCGSRCLLFCSGPCLLSCGGGDFPDPIDPNPPGCSGPDCVNGRCTGPRCVNGGCTGDDCDDGVCTGPKCTSGGCSGPDCVDGTCVGTNCCYGPGCVNGYCYGSSCVQGSDGDDDNDCTSKETAPFCTETVSTYYPTTGGSTASTSTSTTETSCRTVTACSVSASTTTTHISDDPTCALYTVPTGFPFAFGPDGPIVSSMTIPAPTDLILITGGSAGQTTTIGTAKPSTTTTITVTITPTVTLTTTVTVSPTAAADCAFWDAGWGWIFEIYNIQGGWVDDGGKGLHDNENGCGALTGWDFQPAGSELALVHFNLPFFIKDGCVERAIVSAGGPKISCQGQGFSKRDAPMLGWDKELSDEIRFVQTGKDDEIRLRQKTQAEEDLRRRALGARQATAGANPGTFTSTPSYSYSSTTSQPTYTAMSWNGTNNTVTYEYYSITTETTVITTLVPISGTINGTQSTTSITPAYPTQSGIAPNCNAYAEAVSGDYCYIFAQNNNITTDQLYAWNQILGPNGANCSNEFLAGYDYCVGVSTVGTPTSTTATVTSSTPSMTASAVPTQSGIDPDCNKLVAAQSGDYCYKFAQDNSITTDQLYDWNTILGPGGQNCSTEFLAGYGYCVSVS